MYYSKKRYSLQTFIILSKKNKNSEYILLLLKLATNILKQKDCVAQLMLREGGICKIFKLDIQCNPRPHMS